MAHKVTKPLTEYEITKILNNVTQDVKNSLLIQLNTGLRISDIVRLKYSDIQFGKLEVIEKKTGKPQITKINMDLVQYVFEHRTILDSDYIFWNGKTKIDSIIRKIEKQIIKACDYENINSEFISTHSFRKTFATNAYKETNDILVVQYLLNHSSVSVTQRYIQINKDKADSFRSKSRIGF